MDADQLKDSSSKDDAPPTGRRPAAHSDPAFPAGRSDSVVVASTGLEGYSTSPDTLNAIAEGYRRDSTAEAEETADGHGHAHGHNAAPHEHDADGRPRPPPRAHTPDPFEDSADIYQGMHPSLQPVPLPLALPFRWQQLPQLPDLQQARLISERLPAEVMQQRSLQFFELMATRRSLRFFASDDIPANVIEDCVATAGTCPSGVHKQPWFYAIVRRQDLKQRIREAVEEEEKSNYGNERRMRADWKKEATAILQDSRLTGPEGTPQKTYLTEAPVLIAAFKQTHGIGADGAQVDNYWVGESVGMSVGFLQVALHNVGLATLPTRPSGAEHRIRSLLGRPANEKLFLLLPVGYPSKDATVPYREVPRKDLREICAVY